MKLAFIRARGAGAGAGTGTGSGGGSLHCSIFLLVYNRESESE
jgi:hypothetical protein